MTPPPLPDGCTGYPVDPHIHTSVAVDPERDDWTDATPSFDQHCGTTPGLIDHTQPETTP